MVMFISSFVHITVFAALSSMPSPLGVMCWTHAAHCPLTAELSCQPCDAIVCLAGTE